MATHTPGPWHVENANPHADADYTRIVDSNGDDVIGLTHLEESAWISITDADAVLIAAAPDLLEALILMDELVEGLWKGIDWGKTFFNGNTLQLLNEAPLVAKRAIAKAKGES